METLIKNGTVVVGDGKTVREEAWIGIEKGRICAIGQDKKTLASAEQGAARVIDASEMFVLPGVINAHTHGCSVGPLFSSAARAGRGPASVRRLTRPIHGI